MKTVVVGMSGGVDSSVSALLLKQQGYRVIGLFMKNWEEEGPCQSAKEFEDVVSVCTKLDIPYYSVNFVEEYRESVFNEFLEEILKGLTPNPDILCNREIKFKVFLEKALQLGADFLATGHYCRRDEEGRLLKGIDPNKDQSYFLHQVSCNSLKKTLFPIGHLMKDKVRQIAKENGLSTAEKKDSRGICFIGKRDFKPFVQKFIDPKPGPFQTLNGVTVGTHDGAYFYTIGQRKGMGLGGEGDAWFVVGKDVEKNIVFVERGADHPTLFKSHLTLRDLFFIKDEPKNYPFQCTAKIRYRQTDTPCTLFENGEVYFQEPQRAITPGQSIVFYEGDICLGGAVITSVF